MALAFACGKRSGFDRGDANHEAIARSGEPRSATEYADSPAREAQAPATQRDGFAASPDELQGDDTSAGYESASARGRANGSGIARNSRHSSSETAASAPAPAKANAQELAASDEPARKRRDSFRPKEERPGLGTSWGETRTSRVETVSFEREQPNQPREVVSIYYNDERGIVAQTATRSISTLGTNLTTLRDGFVSVEIVDPEGVALPGLTQSGRTYVLGRDGDRYAIRIQNHERFRVEIVASVDGLDVMDGTSASFQKRGYVLDPYATLLIEGFRRSTSAVASFRFGSVAESYAARTGSDRQVGVIGVAVFEERGFSRTPYTRREIMRRETADPFPNRFAQPPRPLED
jgi:hypothetical protein